MTSKLRQSKIGICYGRVNDNNYYDDSYMLGGDPICHNCSLRSECNYYDKEGSDNRRCFRYLSKGTTFRCILFIAMNRDYQSFKRDLIIHSRKV